MKSLSVAPHVSPGHGQNIECPGWSVERCRKVAMSALCPGLGALASTWCRWLRVEKEWEPSSGHRVSLGPRELRSGPVSRGVPFLPRHTTSAPGVTRGRVLESIHLLRWVTSGDPWVTWFMLNLSFATTGTGKTHHCSQTQTPPCRGTEGTRWPTLPVSLQLNGLSGCRTFSIKTGKFFDKPVPVGHP